MYPTYHSLGGYLNFFLKSVHSRHMNHMKTHEINHIQAIGYVRKHANEFNFATKQPDLGKGKTEEGGGLMGPYL